MDELFYEEMRRMAERMLEIIQKKEWHDEPKKVELRKLIQWERM